jgi:hypothetical protein
MNPVAWGFRYRPKPRICRQRKHCVFGKTCIGFDKTIGMSA